jgi:hypothetical protein
MNLREFLRRAFGGRYHGDRLHLYRKYLLEQFTGIVIVEEMYPLIGKPDARPPDKRVDDFIAQISLQGFTDSVRCFEKIHDLQQWQKRNKIDQRRKANASRWLKENRKKLLAVLSHRINALSQPEKCSLASPKSKKVQVRILKSDTSHPGKYRFASDSPCHHIVFLNPRMVISLHGKKNESAAVTPKL